MSKTTFTALFFIFKRVLDLKALMLFYLWLAAFK
jgi:hypothetical protein